MLLAVLGLTWQRPNFFGTQYTYVTYATTLMATCMVRVNWLQFLKEYRTTSLSFHRKIYESAVCFLACTVQVLIYSCVLFRYGLCELSFVLSAGPGVQRVLLPSPQLAAVEPGRHHGPGIKHRSCFPPEGVLPLASHPWAAQRPVS